MAALRRYFARSATLRMSDAIAPAGADAGRVKITTGAVVAFLAMSGVAPTLRVTSMVVAELTGRATSDRPKVFA